MFDFKTARKFKPKYKQVPNFRFNFRKHLELSKIRKYRQRAGFLEVQIPHTPLVGHG